VRGINKLAEEVKLKKDEAPAPPPLSTQEQLLTEIRDLLKK
jgi:large-conductance mechanosensitive channel